MRTREISVRKYVIRSDENAFTPALALHFMSRLCISLSANCRFRPILRPYRFRIPRSLAALLPPAGARLLFTRAHAVRLRAQTSDRGADGATATAYDGNGAVAIEVPPCTGTRETCGSQHVHTVRVREGM